MKTARAMRPIGRPRSFCKNEALSRALRVFWARGYEGASLDDLTAAMKISRPSLYAAFGNKETLFRQALARYRAEASGFVENALAQATARAVAEAYLVGSVEHLSDASLPRGCMIVHAALACGSGAETIRRELILARREAMQALRRRFASAEKEGELPSGTTAADWARYLCTVTNGLSVQAVNGATRHELHRVAQLALKAWPV